VQKRACEYAKLFENAWDADRKKEICIAVPPFKPTVETFKNIPVGETDMDLDVKTLKMPGASAVNYDDHISKNTENNGHSEHREIPVPSRPRQEVPVPKAAEPKPV
jgi:hypothetical protein